MRLLRREDFDELLDRAAERGAERVLTHLGLENGHAARDIRELRDLLEAWRDASRTKTDAFAAAVTAGAGWGTAILHAWTGADQALWGSVLNFWFLGRAFDRVKS